MREEIHALILAAGASSRLGRPKALLRDVDGKSLLQRAVETAREAGPNPAVAVRSGDEAVAAEARRNNARVIEVRDASEGMSASIRAGVAAIEAAGEAQAILVMLVDQWRLSAADLGALIAAWKAGGCRIAAARYAGVLGVPAIFGRGYFGALSLLTGDCGARDFLRSGSEAICAVDMPSAQADVDTEDDLAAAPARVAPCGAKECPSQI